MRALLLSLVTLLLTALPSLAQTSVADILAANRDQIEKPSRQTIGPVPGSRRGRTSVWVCVTATAPPS